MSRQRGLQNTTFTAVGYGLQQINPVFVVQLKIRMVAHPRLIQINTGFDSYWRAYFLLTRGGTS